jgi:hypothetical protein
MKLRSNIPIGLMALLSLASVVSAKCIDGTKGLIPLSPEHTPARATANSSGSKTPTPPSDGAPPLAALLSTVALLLWKKRRNSVGSRD